MALWPIMEREEAMMGWRRFAGAMLVLVGCMSASVARGLQTGSGPAREMESPGLRSQLHEAIGAAEQGDREKALALAEVLVQQHPDYEPALKFEGALLEQMGRRTEAAAAYEAALKLAPADPELLLEVGVYQLVAGDRGEAVRLFHRRLKVLPNDGDTLYYLAQAYHLQGDNEQALNAIVACVKAEPGNASVWQKYGELLCSSGDNEGGLRWLLKAQHAEPTLNRIDFDLGIASYKSMDLDNALEYSTKAVQQRPNDLTALALLAAVEVKLAKWQDAEPIFRTILSAKSDDATSLLGLGHCELEMKEYQPAADTLERVLQQDPTLTLAHFYLSKAYTALGRTADAQHEAEIHSKMLEQLSAEAPEGDNDREKAVLAQARQMLEDGKEPAALQLFREQSKGPMATPGGAYVLVGAVYMSMDKDEEANRVLRQALKVEPGVRGAHTTLGLLALQQNDLETAESEFEAELARDPNDQGAMSELGEVRYRQGRWADAAAQISKSRTMAPSLLYMLCDSYFRLGDVKQADLTAELLVDYAKKQPEVVQGVIDLLNRNQQTELAVRLSNKRGI
jgi:tetratricopeptide (TPR) repeat protein